MNVMCPECAKTTAGKCFECQMKELQPQPQQHFFGQTGWMCPGCGQCYSPFTAKCWTCGPKTITTTGVGVTWGTVGMVTS